MNKTTGLLASCAYIAVVVLANTLTSRYGLVPVGLGLFATAGTYCAGAALVLRDLTQRQLGRAWSVLLIAAGSALSFALADPHIATASLAAFAISETVDFAIYTPLRRSGFILAATASVLVAAAVDTYVFLRIAGFPVTSLGMAGQLLGKSYALAAVILIAGITQARTRRLVVA